MLKEWRKLCMCLKLVETDNLEADVEKIMLEFFRKEDDEEEEDVSGNEEYVLVTPKKIEKKGIYFKNKMNCVVNTAWDRNLKPFLLAVIAKTIQLLRLHIISPVDREREPDLEAAMQQVPDERTKAIRLTLLPFQIPSGQLPLPVIFDFLGLSVLLAFTCILVSRCIHFSYCPAGITIVPIFHHFGLFFGVTTFFISITIPFPSWFKYAAYYIYDAAFLLVLLHNLHFNKYCKPHGFKYPTPNNSISKTAIDAAVGSCRRSTSTIDDQECTKY
ncbi:hypothetical protein DVH24_042074 [Malus domestica]|nr:hypothetical protein DVH24_042074 [Malus domestica]